MFSKHYCFNSYFGRCKMILWTSKMHTKETFHFSVRRGIVKFVCFHNFTLNLFCTWTIVNHPIPYFSHNFHIEKRLVIDLIAMKSWNYRENIWGLLSILYTTALNNYDNNLSKRHSGVRTDIHLCLWFTEPNIREDHVYFECGRVNKYVICKRISASISSNKVFRCFCIQFLFL